MNKIIELYNEQIKFEKGRLFSLLNGDIKQKEIYLFVNLVLFVIWFFSLGRSCPCKTKPQDKQMCYRFEIYGIQVNHIYYFFLLGYFFPEYFIIIQTFGIVWELFEYYLDKNDKLLSVIGGCLDKKPKVKNWHTKQLVYANKEKNYNIIDRIFGIRNSVRHGWHHSVAEIVINILAFGMGSYFQNINIGYIIGLIIIIVTLDI